MTALRSVASLPFQRRVGYAPRRPGGRRIPGVLLLPPAIRYLEAARPAGALSSIWGFMRTVYFCAACGAPYRMQLKQGAYQMIGRRGGNLCVCSEKVRGICAKDDTAQGGPHERYVRFLDFLAMWISCCPRSVGFLELDAAGVGVGA